jgi:thiamine-phosphate pyrophosphorylase
VTVCLVTDRRRADPIAQARHAAAAGIDLVQVRERDLDAAPLTALVRQIVDAVRRSATRVVVNDRLDVALVSGAHGVHLRADSIPVAAARRLAPSAFLIGRSIHSPDEAVAADGADYLIAGTAFPSASKPETTDLLGEDGLRRIVQATRIPVLAIGGIGGDTIGAVARAGAAGIAAIGLFAVPGPLEEIVRNVRARFDSVKTAP